MNAAAVRSYSAAETLKGGAAVTVRAIRPDDRERLGEAFGKLEAGSVYTRFFSHRGQPSDEELRAAVEVDFEATVALVVTVPDGEGGEAIIGAGRYLLHGPPGAGSGAEVAFTVEEDYQGQGMAGLILRHLALIARRQGVSELTAEVLPTNRGMLAVFRRSGLPMRSDAGDGVVHVALSLAHPPPLLVIIREQDQKRLLEAAGRHLCEKVRGVLTDKGRAVVAVPGGRSAAAIFQTMLREELDWRRVHFFIVDERLVPVDHPDSNFKLLQEHLVAPLVQAGRTDPGNAHPFVLDTTSADRGAARYERELTGYGFRYDVVLLSAGEDGHVGALYPRHHSVEDRHHGFIVMDDSPKPPPGRMTSSLSLMQTASAGVLIFAGEAKREAWARFNDTACHVADCPARLVLGIGDAAVFTDLP